MAKRKLGITLLIATALGGTGYGAFQESRATELERRVERIEGRLARVETYVQAQVVSLRKFGKSLDAAVKKGFIAGINFESRKTLVRGFRGIVKAAAETTPRPANKKR